MRYVHHQPRHEAAERLGRHFTGAASELDARGHFVVISDFITIDHLREHWCFAGRF
jgi:hypothetical protein